MAVCIYIRTFPDQGLLCSCRPGLTDAVKASLATNSPGAKPRSATSPTLYPNLGPNMDEYSVITIQEADGVRPLGTEPAPEATQAVQALLPQVGAKESSLCVPGLILSEDSGVEWRLCILHRGRGPMHYISSATVQLDSNSQLHCTCCFSNPNLVSWLLLFPILCCRPTRCLPL